MTKTSNSTDVTTIQSDSLKGQGTGAGGGGQQARIVKLVDVQDGALAVIYPLLPVTIVDGEVYASGILVGRVPAREKVKQGSGRIHKVVASKKEVSIII